VSDSYGESIMATATWIDESLIDDAATRRQFNWPTMIYAGVNVGIVRPPGRRKWPWQSELRQAWD
jgi:hypothetical protein